jgi:type IV pilus assembly protein PilM
MMRSQKMSTRSRLQLMSTLKTRSHSEVGSLPSLIFSVPARALPPRRLKSKTLTKTQIRSRSVQVRPSQRHAKAFFAFWRRDRAQEAPVAEELAVPPSVEAVASVSESVESPAPVIAPVVVDTPAPAQVAFGPIAAPAPETALKPMEVLSLPEEPKAKGEGWRARLGARKANLADVRLTADAPDKSTRSQRLGARKVGPAHERLTPGNRSKLLLALGLRPRTGDEQDTPPRGRVAALVREAAATPTPVEERLLAATSEKSSKAKRFRLGLRKDADTVVPAPAPAPAPAPVPAKKKALVLSQQRPTRKQRLLKAMGLNSRTTVRAEEFEGGRKSSKDVPLEGFSRIDVEQSAARRVFQSEIPQVPARGLREKLKGSTPIAGSPSSSALASALSVIGFSRKPPEGAATAKRIIRLDEVEQALPTADQGAPAPAPSPALGVAANATAQAQALSVRARLARLLPQRALTFTPALPLLIVPALVLAFLLVALPRVPGAPKTSFIIDVGVVVLAEVFALIFAISRYNRDRHARDKFTWSSLRQLLGERAHDEASPIAFLGGESQRSEHARLWQRALVWLLPKHEVYGLDIGASHLRAALVRDGVIVSVVSRPIPRGIIVDGILLEPEALAVELRALWEQAGFDSKEVNFALANRQVALKTLSLAAAVDERDMELAVAVNAETVLRPMNTETAVIDYAELSRTSARMSVQLAAAEREMVESYVAAVQGAGLTCISCELGPLAEGRALIVPRHAGVAHGVVNIGAEKTSFIYASGADIFFLRIVEIGGNDFTTAIQRAVGCTWEEAELLKLRSGLALAPTDPELAPEMFAICQEALQPVADRLTQELAGTPHLFLEGQEGRPVAGLTLLGGGARLAGLTEQISMFMRVAALTAPTARPGVEIGGEFPAYATAIGLALGHRMSLLPDTKGRSFSLDLPGRRRKPKLETERAKRQAKRLRSGRGPEIVSPTSIALIVAILIGGGSYIYSKHLKSQSLTLNTQIQQAQSALTSVPPLVAPIYKGVGLTSGNAADSVAARLVLQPNYKTLQAIIAVCASAQVTVNSITVGTTVASGNTFSITGSGSAAALSALRSKLESKTFAIANLKIASGATSAQGTVTFEAPMWGGK